MTAFDFSTADNSYEVIAYDSLEDIALIKEVFSDMRDKYLIVRNIKFIYGKYQFDFIESHRKFICSYEAYQKRVIQYDELVEVEFKPNIQFRKEGTQ